MTETQKILDELVKRIREMPEDIETIAVDSVSVICKLCMEEAAKRSIIFGGSQEHHYIQILEEVLEDKEDNEHHA